MDGHMTIITVLWVLCKKHYLISKGNIHVLGWLLKICQYNRIMFLIRMWIILASLLAVALVNADDAASVVPEASSDATVPPPDAEPGFEGKIPTAEQLLEMLDSMSGISDEEKSSLREDLLKNIRVGGVLAQAGDQLIPGNNLTTQTVVLLCLLSVVALIFGKYFLDLKGVC